MMMERSRVFFILLLLAGCMLSAAGCTSPRTSDTHNTTIVIQDYNQWAEAQGTYAGQVKISLTRMEATIDAYNHDASSGSSDPGTLQSDVASDGQTIAQWGVAGTALSTATDSFSSDTSSLMFGSDQETPWLAGLLAQEMKIYDISMTNAQQHFVDYNRYMGSYLSVDAPDYRDDSLRTAAMDAKTRALASLSDADIALSNITATAKQLQQRQ
ncbi:hypothetical protein Mboo_2420 [Methanoregula boonei 6A8]|jgi:hypothetical protein|uniref:Uncharacterized protein n=2 Tax=Methanoregula TaxID=395331 RepID=A7IB23_METB6|nr:hypothetical protein Mboo_2420 [Methanoregula boonei 6A8]